MTPFQVQRGLDRCPTTRIHGTRACYTAGCRCDACRAANAAYERHRSRLRARGDWNGLVDASAARRHLRKLARLGIGCKSVAAAVDISANSLHAIRSGAKRKIRARTERKILAVDEGCASNGSRIPARRTWALLHRLIEDGYTKRQLARWMGYRNETIQFRRTFITAANAAKVERMYRLIEAGRLKRDR